MIAQLNDDRSRAETPGNKNRDTTTTSKETTTTSQRRRRQCQRAWTFERVAGYEMRTKPRRRLKLATKELCMEACLLASDFECRSANWYRQSGECALSDQDRHSVSQAEAGDQRTQPQTLYGPAAGSTPAAGGQRVQPADHAHAPSGLYQNYYSVGVSERSRSPPPAAAAAAAPKSEQPRLGALRQLFGGGGAQLEHLRHGSEASASAAVQYNLIGTNELLAGNNNTTGLNDDDWHRQSMPHYATLGGLPTTTAEPVHQVDYLENNCVYEPNKLCEFRKIQNKILKTVDSIYQDVASLEECKQKCLQAPYRCYSFDYGDTSERVCRTSHLDQASLMSVRDPYLEVVGAITYELASCFNVTIQCRAREMVAQVSSNKMFRGKIYAKSRPSSCQNDVRESLNFELAMKYHDDGCDVRSSSNDQRGVFSNDIIIQHHDRIVTTQDVGLSVYCQYDLGNRSITNNVDLAIERLDDDPLAMESKTPFAAAASAAAHGQGQQQQRPAGGTHLTITSLATTVVRSPNVTMRITNMNGQPVSSATVGDRLALLFEIKEKTSEYLDHLLLLLHQHRVLREPFRLASLANCRCCVVRLWRRSAVRG